MRLFVGARGEFARIKSTIAFTMEISVCSPLPFVRKVVLNAYIVIEGDFIGGFLNEWSIIMVFKNDVCSLFPVGPG